MDVNNTILNNTTAPGCIVIPDSPFSKGFKIFGYVLITVLSLFGNVVVVWVVLKTPRMRTVTNYFIVNVSLADLLTAVFNMIPTLFWVVKEVDVWYVGGSLGEALCKLLQFFQLVSIACSVFSMAAIAFDRVFAICRPLKRTITFLRAKWIIVWIWIASCVIASPNLYILRLKMIDGIGHCVEKWGPVFNEESSPLVYTIALFIWLYGLPLLLIAFLYTIVIVRLLNRATPGQYSKTNRSNREKTNRRVLKMLITVVVVFACCWLPLYVRMFLMFNYPTRYLCGLPYQLDFITLYLGHANSSVNPYIYVIFNENFRRGFKAIVHKQGLSDQYTSTRLASYQNRESGKMLLKVVKTNDLPSASHNTLSYRPGDVVLSSKTSVNKDMASSLL